MALIHLTLQILLIMIIALAGNISLLHLFSKEHYEVGQFDSILQKGIFFKALLLLPFLSYYLRKTQDPSWKPLSPMIWRATLNTASSICLTPILLPKLIISYVLYKKGKHCYAFLFHIQPPYAWILQVLGHDLRILCRDGGIRTRIRILPHR